MIRKLALGLCAFAFAASFAVAASAYTITAASSPLPIYLGGNVGGTNYSDLTATATFSVYSWSGSTVVLDVSIENTAGSNWQGATVTAIGFDTDPTVVSATSSGVFNSAVISGSFPNNFGSIDLCAIYVNNPPANNCNGGNGGVTIGTSGTARITLNFSSAVTSIDLTNIGIRWQQLNSTFYGISDGSGTGGEVPPIPEPSAAIVFGIGALILGASRAKR